MKRLDRIHYILFCMVLLVASACGGATEQSAAPLNAVADQPADPVLADEPAEVDESLLAAGQEIFGSKGICFTCHGPDGTGTQLAPNLTDGTWLNIEPPPTIDKIIAMVKEGVMEPIEHPAPMAPMGGAQLSEDELRAVASYVLSLSQ